MGVVSALLVLPSHVQLCIVMFTVQGQGSDGSEFHRAADRALLRPSHLQLHRGESINKCQTSYSLVRGVGGSGQGSPGAMSG